MRAWVTWRATDPIRRPPSDVEGDRLHGSLQIIELKDTLMGRAIEGAVIKKTKKPATDAGAALKIADGSIMTADGQLASTPCVLFDAVAVMLSDEGAQALPAP